MEKATRTMLTAALAAVMAWTSRGRGGIKFLDVAGVVTFGAIAVAGFIGGDSLGEWLTNFARGGSTLILAALMLISAATVPFTEQYAKDSVPEERWSSPLFRATNRKVSAVWGLAVLFMGVGHVVAGQRPQLAQTVGIGDHGRPGVEGEAVLLPHVSAPAGLVARFKKRGGGAGRL